MSRLRPIAITLACAISATALGCSSPGTPASTGLVASGGHLALSASVPAGRELYRCQFVELSDAPTNLIAGASTMTPGSHHLILYQTGLTTAPKAGPFDCLPTDYMEDISGIVYAAQTEESRLDLPAGVGLPIAGAQILFLQSHYLNATTAPLDASVDVRLTLADDGAVTTQAATLFFYDFNIYVPAAGTSSAILQCPIPGDIHLVGAGSHMHARGTAYRADVIDLMGGIDAMNDGGAGNSGNSSNPANPIYSTMDWSAPTPAIFDPPLDIKGGSAIQYRCDYQNNGDHDYYTGFSAVTDEMCMFVGIYYPALDFNTNFCLVDALVGRGVGSGTSPGADTLACLGGCSDDNCDARCVTESCAGISTAMNDWRDCRAAHCADMCKSTAGSTCTDCLSSTCATEASALAAARCD